MRGMEDEADAETTPSRGSPSRGSSSGGSKARENSLTRMTQVLDFLHVSQRPVSVGALARGMGAARSSTYSLVHALVEAELLEMTDDGRRVFFGKKLHLYGLDYMRQNELLRRGREEVDRLSRETGETSELCMLQEGRYTIVHSCPGARPFRISSAVGLQIPIPWTASGRLLLSGMSREEIAVLVSPDDLVLPNGRTIALDDFLADIDEAATAGYCVTSGLVDAYTRCLAAPVIAADGTVVATVCLVVPVDTGEPRVATLLATLRERAQLLSARPSLQRRPRKVA